MVQVSALFLLIGVISPPSSLVEDLAAEYRRIVYEMPLDERGAAPDPAQPANAERLRRLWTLLGHRAAAVLESRPEASADALAAALMDLDAEAGVPEDQRYLDVTAVELATGDRAAYAVAANWGWSGTLFVVARRAGRFEVVWDIKALAEQSYSRRDESEHHFQLGYWAHLSPGFHDGPLTGSVHALPPGPSGQARFYLDATTNPMAGVERASQLSVWEWRGTDLADLFIKTYSTASWEGAVDSKDDLLKVRVQQRFKTLYTCGSCEDGPEEVWTLRVPPSGVVEDLGRQPLVPELRLADELIYRIQRYEDVSDLATPEVERILAPWLREDIQSGEESDLIGMLGSWKVARQGEVTLLELRTDELPPLVLSIASDRGKPRVRAAEVLKQD